MAADRWSQGKTVASSTGLAQSVRKYPHGSVQPPHARLCDLDAGDIARVQCLANAERFLRRCCSARGGDAPGGPRCRHAALSRADHARPVASGACNCRVQPRGGALRAAVPSNDLLSATNEPGEATRMIKSEIADGIS